MPLLRTLTLGCKVNQYETQYVREGLARLGYQEAPEGTPADLCVVNTCTVTVEGAAKSRKLIRQLARENPRAEIVVMGCYATRAPQEVAALPGVVEVIGDKRQLPDWLARRGLIDVPTGISTFAERHRAYVKVQDGCSMECSYCIIPQVRPVLASRPMTEILDEVVRLVEHGHREIVLTGIHLGHYGADRGDGGDLARLVRRIVQLGGEFRVRLSSLEAAEVTADVIAVLAEYPDRVCPHLHIPMQSGSDSVLRRMRRRWPAEAFIQRCREVCAALDCPALTTDVIVGFPGESDPDFAATCRAVESVGFSKLHVFRYSPRQGTPAAEMPDQVPGRVRQQRAAELSELGDRLRRRFFERLAGRRLHVLIETALGGPATTPPLPPGEGWGEGRGGFDLPSKPISPHLEGREQPALNGHDTPRCPPPQDSPPLLLGMSDRYAPVELLGGREQIGRLVWVTAGPVVGGRIRARDSGGAPSGGC